VGYKNFVAGEEALAADVNSFLMAQTVARFPTAAARTSQLAAPALNQLSSLDTRPGALQYWNGSAWADVSGVVLNGVSVVSTDANGLATITFTPAGIYGSPPTVTANAQGSGMPGAVLISIGTITTANFAVRAFNPGGTPMVAGLSISWIAVGPRA